MIQKRDLVTCIILYIVTCGLYGIVWMVTLTDDSNIASEAPTADGGMAILFTILTCGVYYFYWLFKLGDKIDIAKQKRGMQSTSTGVVYLLLGLFSLQIVAYALAQGELNKLEA